MFSEGIFFSRLVVDIIEIVTVVITRARYRYNIEVLHSVCEFKRSPSYYQHTICEFPLFIVYKLLSHTSYSTSTSTTRIYLVISKPYHSPSIVFRFYSYLRHARRVISKCYGERERDNVLSIINLSQEPVFDAECTR